MLKYVCRVNRLESGNASLSQLVSNFSGHGTLSLSQDLLLTQMMTIEDFMEVEEVYLYHFVQHTFNTFNMETFKYKDMKSYKYSFNLSCDRHVSLL